MSLGWTLGPSSKDDSWYSWYGWYGSRSAISSSDLMDSLNADPLSPAKSWNVGRSKAVSASSLSASRVEGGLDDDDDEGFLCDFLKGGGFGVPRWGRRLQRTDRKISHLSSHFNDKVPTMYRATHPRSHKVLLHFGSSAGWLVDIAALLWIKKGIFCLRNFHEDMQQYLATDWMGNAVTDLLRRAQYQTQTQGLREGMQGPPCAPRDFTTRDKRRLGAVCM